MAIAGGAKPSIEMQIKDGQLIMGKAALRQSVVGDVDLAVQRLLQGETVFVQQYGATVTAVQKTLEMTLRGKP